MKLLIIGSRNIDNIDLEQYIPDGTKLIIFGGAKGIDTLAERYADKNRISKLIIRPEYDKYGRCAPLKRNEIMIDLCDKIIAFWDGKSKGTKHSIEYARKKLKDIKIILI